MNILTSEVIGDIEKYKFNPIMIHRTALDVLKKATDGSINIVDPSNPFVYALENTALNTAAFMQQNEATTRRLYPSAAIDTEDLYLHMSDKDYIDRFVKPATAKITITLDQNELLNRLVTDPETGIKKITIPRNTVFTVADIPFSLQYPIDIRQLSHGGLQIVYINDKESPLQKLNTNIVEWNMVIDTTGKKFVQFTVDVTQFSIETKYNDVSASSGFKTDIAITDDFYYCRVYTQNDNGTWNEILTTHTKQIYDPNTPTAVIKVINKRVQVVIPVIYTSTNLVRGKIRIDVYQSKGYLNMLLSNYRLEDFTANWINVDRNDDNEYTTPIRQFKTIAIYSTTHVNSGRDALSFNELKQRVIKNAIGQQNLPITPTQLETNLEDFGYDIVKNIDTITNRIFLAVRDLPNPSDDKILTKASAAMSTIQVTLKEIAQAYGAKNNGDSVTLTSKTIYQNKNGITKPITPLEYSELMSLPILQRCETITTGNYFYSPFAYVLNANKDTFEVRPYHLDDPEIIVKNFSSENATTGYRVSIRSYRISKNDNGYILNIVTDSSDAFRNLDDSSINVQLAFKSKNQNGKVYLLGQLVGKDPKTKERLYQFDLTTNFNIDNDDYLEFTSFEDQTNGLAIKSKLLEEVDIFFTTNAGMSSQWQFSNIDNLIGHFQLPTNSVGITHEILTVRYGYALKNLWALSRSVVSSVPYQVYMTDVLDVYERDVYEIDPETGTYFTIDEEGKLVYTLKHVKGDPVLDSNGNQKIKHYKGEIVYDEAGSPLVVPGYERDMIRLVDVMLVEGPYYFATDTIVSAYRKAITNSIVTWVTQEMTDIQKRLLDQTKIFFYPKITAGDISVYNSQNLRKVIPAAQSIKVKLFISPKTNKDETLKAALQRTTIKTIDTEFQKTTISISSIEKALREIYQGDVIDVEVSGIGTEDSKNTLSVLDKSKRCSIRKRLVALPDNQLVVEEDVTFEFIEHGREI